MNGVYYKDEADLDTINRILMKSQNMISFDVEKLNLENLSRQKIINRITLKRIHGITMSIAATSYRRMLS